jgi:MSHA pilin protein MshC
MGALLFLSVGVMNDPHKNAGYTLIELVTVITILGIIAAIAGPRFFDTKPFNERGYADEVATSLRYSQKVAVSSGCSVQFTISTTSYSAAQQAASGNTCNASSSSWTTPVMSIDGRPVAGAPPNNANVTVSATWVFDRFGVVTSGPATLVVGAYTLSINAATGFVVVQ